VALIAVDMTPVLPGGINGGVRLLALELLKGFQTLSREHHFLILTTSENHESLTFLDGPRTRRLCVLDQSVRKILGNFPMPARIKSGLRKIYNFLQRSYRATSSNLRGPLSENGVDVLFCPFTATVRAEPGIPVVSLVCDLQHRDYPQFFSPDEYHTREYHFSEVCKRADAIVCISETTRKSVIRHLNVDPGKISAIPICIQSRLAGLDASNISEHLLDLRIDARPYMFYPANFWPHKNHQTLLDAYEMYVSRNPDREMDLVFTGALDDAQRELKEKVRSMGLKGRVHFLGYLPEEKMLAVWKSCSFMVFPSLYEGFGIPVLEAMQFGKPVLCSNVTSLPEVAGDAALYFDPREPDEIVRCLERIMDNQELYVELVRRGQERVKLFEPHDMVLKYLQCLEGVISECNRLSPS